ncbi:CD1107 family mobile element protein [Aerococcus viridans]
MAKTLIKRSLLAFSIIGLLSSTTSFQEQVLANESSSSSQESSQSEQSSSSESNQTESIVGDEEVDEDSQAPEAPSVEGGSGYEVTENTDENGEQFNPNLSNEDLEGKKQFLTFQTADNETYHIIVDYGRSQSKVHLLKAVNNDEIESIATNNTSESEKADEATTEEENTSSEAEAPAEDEEQSSSPNWLLIVILMAVMVGILYFFKKKKESGSNIDD